MGACKAAVVLLFFAHTVSARWWPNPKEDFQTLQSPLADFLLAMTPTASFKTRYGSKLSPAQRPQVLQMEEEAAESEEEEFKGAESWSAQFAEPEAVFDINKVKELLPHRYPFLLVDKVIEFVPGKKAVAIKKVTANEEFFNGHFPNRPIMPGVLQLEAMAQVGGIIALQEPITDGKGDFFFAGVNNVKWRRPVVPGDTLVMQMELTAFKPRFGLVKMKGVSYIDGKKVVEGEFQFAMVK
mmetsp:Transcript_69991/g.111042  ORF Transcript_69991/g.111042 Transcript_69991/m.111042 type:complete len:240 (+) Transcript_69991:44-763(+)